MEITSIICLNHKNIPFTLIRSKRRRKIISLQIKENKGIFLYVPYHMTKGEVERFVQNRQAWVIKKLGERERIQKEPEHSFRPGENFLYLGDGYPLEIVEADNETPPLHLSFGRFIIKGGYTAKARVLFIHWYKKEAKKIIEERVQYHSNNIKLFPKGIRITSAKYRWGSCSRDDRLSFSWRVIMAPLSVVDYVLIHELVHIKEKNHSKRFWRHLEAIFPNYKEQRMWLKKNGSRLSI